MKKKSLILMVLLSFYFISIAQRNVNNFNWACSFGVNNIYSPMGLIGDATIGLSTDGFWNRGGEKSDNSYSINIIPKYFISKDLLLRFEFGITNINETRIITVSSSDGILYNNNYPIIIDTIEQKTYRYIPGIQWNAFRDTKIGMHVGVSLPYISCSNLIYKSHNELRDITTNALTSEVDVYRNVPGGYGLGVGALAGFDYYLLKKISVGAEFSNAFIYYKIGGNVTVKETNLIPVNISGTGTSIERETYKGMRLEKIFSSFNITIYF